MPGTDAYLVYELADRAWGRVAEVREMFSTAILSVIFFAEDVFTHFMAVIIGGGPQR